MDMQKALPHILKLRAQNALGKTVTQLLSTDDANIAQAILADGTTAYVNLRTRKEVQLSNVKPSADAAPVNTSFITREKAVGTDATEKKTTNKRTVKKSTAVTQKKKK